MEKRISETEISYYWDDKKLAFVRFQIKDGVLDILQTVVDPSLRGQGIAGKLMEEVKGYCLEKGYSYKATCSYAIKYFSSGKHQGYIG
ncbi:MAG: GNAT family N-acetyltransferase [Bacillota bacterium]|nr:GNAT family N-acetyltransferase [Bacillota bacterium]